MKNRTTTLFLAILLSSCTHYYYVPNTQNVPMFKEKNEYRFSASYAAGDESSGAEVQGAYSVTDKIGVMASFMSAKGGDVSKKNWGKGNYFEGAVGYFKPSGKSGVFEIYGGLGGSSQNHEYSSLVYDNNTGTYINTLTGTSSLSFTKLFIQPSWGITFHAFDIAFSTRLSGLFFGNVDNQITGSSSEYDALNKIDQHKDYLFLEPALTIRGGWKNVKVQFQAASASYIFNPDIDFESSHLSLGVCFSFADRFKKEIPNK